MREIAAQVREWAAGGRDVVLARVIGIDGFGGRRAGEAWAMALGEGAVGGLLSGAADEGVVEAAETLLEGRAGALSTPIPVGDADAIAAGLACGGVAHVLVQRTALVPGALWDAIAEREAVALVTAVDGPRAGASVVVRPSGAFEGSIGDAARDAEAVSAGVQLLTRGRSPVALVGEAPARVFVEAVVPQPHLAVVGVAELAEALRRQGAFLGWTTAAVDERGMEGGARAASAAAALGPADALVVLSHDIPASCGALAAAVRGRCGYVGALGSRHTQGARTAYLRDTLGLDAAEVARIHGPVGLDIGARTPEETAVAIFAEILSVRSGRDAGSLRDSAGPING